jgi:hypothetical protein
LGTGQGWVVVGVPRWYRDSRDDDVVGAVGTDRVYHDRVCQQSWRWYRAMVHWMHHRGDNGDAVVVVSDVPVCGRHPKQFSGWGVHVEMQGLERVWARPLVATAVLLHHSNNNNDNVVIVAYAAWRCPGRGHRQWEAVTAGAHLGPACLLPLPLHLLSSPPFPLSSLLLLLPSHLPPSYTNRAGR